MSGFSFTENKLFAQLRTIALRGASNDELSEDDPRLFSTIHIFDFLRLYRSADIITLDTIAAVAFQ